MKTASFQSILEENLNENNFVSQDYFADFTSGWTSVLEPQGLSQLLGQIHVDIKYRAHHKMSYFEGSKNFSAENTKKQIKKSAYALKTLEQSAFDFINGLLPNDQQLSGFFKTTEVKKAFRFAARKAHPDCGGSHDQFLQLKNNFEILLAFLCTIK